MYDRHAVLRQPSIEPGGSVERGGPPPDAELTALLAKPIATTLNELDAYAQKKGLRSSVAR